MKLKFLVIIFLLLFAFPCYAFASKLNSIGTSYTYTNQEQDKSGLMHYDSRYYDPELGRFLQPDSVDVPNKYVYVSNNPVNRIDPSGHFDESFFIDLSKSNKNFHLNTDGTATYNIINYDVADGEGTPIGEMLADGTKSILSEIWRASTVLHRVAGVVKLDEGPEISTDDYFDIAMAPLGGNPLGIVRGGIKIAEKEIYKKTGSFLLGSKPATWTVVGRISDRSEVIFSASIKDYHGFSDDAGSFYILTLPREALHSGGSQESKFISGTLQVLPQFQYHHTPGVRLSLELLKGADTFLMARGNSSLLLSLYTREGKILGKSLLPKLGFSLDGPYYRKNYP